MVVSITVRPGRCYNKPSLLWNDDPVFADLKPSSSFPPDKTLMVSNKFKCAAKCSNTPWCSSFFFTEGTGTCDLYKTVFTEKDRLVPSAGTAYFRIHSGELLPLLSRAQSDTKITLGRTTGHRFRKKSLFNCWKYTNNHDIMLEEEWGRLQSTSKIIS